MKKFIVDVTEFTVHSGKIEITPEQAKRRAYALKKLRGNEYDVVLPVKFKRGEEVGLPDTPKKGSGARPTK